MPTSNNSSNSLQVYEVIDKFGFFGYVMANDIHEAKLIAAKQLPISPSRPDWFVVNPVHIELTEL